MLCIQRGDLIDRGVGQGFAWTVPHTKTSVAPVSKSAAESVGVPGSAAFIPVGTVLRRFLSAAAPLIGYIFSPMLPCSGIRAATSSTSVAARGSRPYRAASLRAPRCGTWILVVSGRTARVGAGLATALFEAAASDLAIYQALGHRSLRSLGRYVCQTVEANQRMLDRVGTAGGGEATFTGGRQPAFSCSSTLPSTATDVRIGEGEPVPVQGLERTATNRSSSLEFRVGFLGGRKAWGKWAARPNWPYPQGASPGTDPPPLRTLRPLTTARGESSQRTARVEALD